MQITCFPLHTMMSRLPAIRGFFLLFIVFLLLPPKRASSQCIPRSNSYYGEMLPNNGCASFASYGPFGPGEYFRMPVLNGASYTISTCGNSIDTQITGYQGTNTTTPIFYNDDNGVDCAGLQASITYVPNFTDYIRPNVNQFNCLPGGTSSVTVKVRQNNNLSITSSASDMCQGQTRNLTATPAAVGSAVTGSGDLGTFTGTGVAGAVFTAPVPAGNSANYTITYTFGYCSATQAIAVYKTPSTSNAGSNQTICATTTNLAGNNPGAGTGTWTKISGPGSISSPTSNTTAVTGLSSAMPTVFRWTISNGPCTASTDDVQITVIANPTASNAGPNQTICANNTTLAGNSPTVGSGQWSLIGGSGTITSPTLPNSTVTSLGAGVNTFRWTISNGICTPSTDDVTITVDAAPTTSVAGPNQSICDTFSVFAGNSPSVGSGAWALIIGSGTPTSVGNPLSPVIALGIGSNQFTWTITNGVCAASKDTVEIFVKVPPTAPTVTGNTTLCAGQFTTLTASSGTSSPAFAWYDSLSGGTQLATGVNFTTLPLFATTTIFAEVTSGTTNCESPRLPVTIIVNPLPIVSAGNDTALCSGNPVCFAATAGFVSYLWSNGDTANSTCPSAAGTQIVTVTDTNSCQASDTVNLTYWSLPLVDLGNDTVFCTGNNLTLDAGSGGFSYAWSTGAGTQTISVVTPGNYFVQVMDTNGCTSSDTVNVSQAAKPVTAFAIDSSGCPVLDFSDNTAGNPGTWSWNFGDGQNSTVQNPTHDYTFSGNGSYTVVLVTGNACGMDSLSVNISINCIVGSEPMQISEQVKLYPNPSDGNFSVSVSGVRRKMELLMIDKAGREVHSVTIREKGDLIIPFELSELASGSYIMKIRIDEREMTRKVVLW